MEHVILPVSLCEYDLTDLCGRYHFDDTGLAGIRRLYDELTESSGTYGVSAYYDVFCGDGNATKGASRPESGPYAEVVMTLGRRLDDKQNCYMKEGRLSEAYMLECLSMVLLLKAYPLMDRRLEGTSGLWCGAYEFPGTKCPLESIEEILERSGQREVTCNEAYALIPQKSVIYITYLQRDRPLKGRAQPLCAGCGRTDCEWKRCEGKGFNMKRGRELNYGYQRIFGGQEKKRGN